MEGTSAIIEGAHMVPGFFDATPFADRILAIPVVVTVEDEETHRSHFVRARGRPRPGRTSATWRAFENIRKVQRYIKSQALSHGVPVVPNYSLDQDAGRDHRPGRGPRVRAAGRAGRAAAGAAPEPLSEPTGSAR